MGLAVRFRKKGDGAPMAGKVGERFVKGRLPGQIKRIMKQLVQHDIGQGCPVITQQVGQQRVGKPAQGAEGCGGPNIGVKSLRLQTPCFCVCFRAVKIPFVRDAADNGEPPGIGFQTRPVGRGDHLNGEWRGEFGHAAITPANPEAEVLSGKGAHAQDDPEFFSGGKIKLTGLPQDVGNGSAVPQNFCFFIAGPQDVQRRASREKTHPGENE